MTVSSTALYYYVVEVLELQYSLVLVLSVALTLQFAEYRN